MSSDRSPSAKRSTIRDPGKSNEHHPGVSNPISNLINNQMSSDSSSSAQRGSVPVHQQDHHQNILVNEAQSSSDHQLIVLATALATAFSHQGLSCDVRILIDQGSEVSLISESLAHQLKLRRRSSKISIFGIGDISSGPSRGLVDLIIQSNQAPYQRIQLCPHILKKLTAKLPPFSAASNINDQLRGLQLADKGFLKPGHIDIIIGADIYGKIIGESLIRFKNSQLIAQNTIFGWVISGPVNSTEREKISTYSALRKTANQQLVEILKRFWLQEELPSTSSSCLTPEEEECEQHFVNTHQRDESGRYIVRLPLKSPASTLGQSKHTALRMLQRTSRKLSADPSYGELYRNFIKEYETLGHMQRAPAPSEDHPAYYLPHHGVLKEDSQTTKLRVVFNASSRTSTGVSLNDILHPGPKLQIDGIDVLIYLRRHRWIFGTDIVKMFRQIKIHQDDWNLLRILWLDEDNNLIEYQLTTVTYGTTSAPWLSLRTLRQLVKDEGHRYPSAVPAITKGKYVDDIYDGAETEEELQGIISDLQKLCMAGGFPLQKWTTNSPLTQERLGIQPGSSVAIDLEPSTVKVLGLQWNPRSDAFTYKVKKFNASLITKRVVLSEIAQIYDPLGLIAPVIIRAKILMQELWLIKANWDDPLPLAFIKRWQIFREELLQLDQLSIPRWLHLASEYSDVQIHGFADASNLAMGAAVYIRSSSPSSDPVVTLVCAKTRVAPLKRMTIPRLELAAALILTELTTHVKKLIERADIETHLWTDSSVALTWINGHPSNWKDFVQNRVQKIQDTEPDAQWHHISGKDNPADCASRGVSPSQLAEHQLWWNGPKWLTQPSSEWPVSTFIKSSDASLEERVPVVTAHPVIVEEADDLLYRFSSLNRLLRVTAMVARAIRRFRRRPIINGPVQPHELDEARTMFVRYVQGHHFEGVLNRLRNGHPLSANHPMSPLTPFIDAEGILRLGGRLKNSILDPDEKHPSIIPRHSQLSMLIIADAHERTLHGGTQSTLAFIRQKHWIIGGRAPVRSYILKCVTCARYRAARAQQLMGQLPHRRVTPSRPFQHTGVDYAGPMFINKWKGTNIQPYKGYICLFVCLATSAIHLEVATDLTSSEFIAAYKRFTARRGICETLTSDQGRTFVGAERELRDLFDEASAASQRIATLLAQDGTLWKFIPAHSPHFGGKWEAAVKSVKHHLKRIIGDMRWTLVELTTLLCQIEAILNSRPLCPLTNDPNDLSVLTPGHFITGAALTTLPEPSLENIEENRLNRWQRIRQRTQIFWKRWSKECIQRYQSIYRWREPRNEIQPGSLVLIIQDNYPPAKWPLARVIGIRPGRDNLTRVAELRTSSGNLTIAIAKLVPLPINTDQLEADQHHQQHQQEPHRDDFERSSQSSSSGDDDGGRDVQNRPQN